MQRLHILQNYNIIRYITGFNVCIIEMGSFIYQSADIVVVQAATAQPWGQG